MIATFMKKNKQKDYKVGDKVLVHWSEDGFWYLGKIINKMNDKYYIKFYKGDKEWRIKEQIHSLKTIKTGEKVLFRNKGSHYNQKGKIKKVYDEKISISPEEKNRKEENVGLADICIKRNL